MPRGKFRRGAAARGKRDANHGEITRAYERVGAGVIDLGGLGGGVSDILVGYGGVNYLVEIKTEFGALNDKQSEFFERWPGHKAVVRTIREALAVIGVAA